MSHVAAALSIGIAAAPRTRRRPAARPAKAQVSGRAPSAIEVRA